MEPRRELSDDELGEERPSLSDHPSDYFRKAFAFARRNYAAQMDHIASTVFEEVTPEKFFLEYIWVVHATGFNAKVVGKMMPRLVEAYGSWRELGAEDADVVVDRVRKVCNNPQKIGAVRSTAGLMLTGVPEDGKWADFRDSKLSSPRLLQELSYIGRITCYHLARNIGLLEYVKPDLHLVRLAKHWGFKDCIAMCRDMRTYHETDSGSLLPLGIVDLVLWYACSTFGTLEARAEGDR